MAERIFPLEGKRIWVAGETGMVGRVLTRALSGMDVELLSAPRSVVDLTVQRATYEWIAQHSPDVIFMAAAKVGGIGANAAYPADFIRDNLSIAQNVIEGAHRADVPRLIFLGSSCIYPKHAPQPIIEESLLTGPLEETNEAYAIAKIAGLKLCQFYGKQYGRRYVSAMPTNLYGPHDRFDAQNAHVLPAMLMKFDAAMREGAERVVLWGTGMPLREFLHVDDLAAALLCLAERYEGDAPVNIGSGEEISIGALARLVQGVTGFQGEIMFDRSKPDGTPRKFLNSSRMRALGWMPSVALGDGVARTYEWYKSCHSEPQAKNLRDPSRRSG